MDPIGSIVLFVIIPAAAALIVVAFVLGPSWSRAGRWRPGEPWRDEPVLLAGDPTLLDGDSDGDGDGGGDGDGDGGELHTPDARPAIPADETPTGVLETAGVDLTSQFGGARGRW